MTSLTRGVEKSGRKKFHRRIMLGSMRGNGNTPKIYKQILRESKNSTEEKWATVKNSSFSS